MELRAHADVEAFLDTAGPLLLGSEARHNLMFGICATLREAPSVFPDVKLWTIENGGEVVGAALRTAPFNIVVAKPVSDAALQFAAEAVAGEGISLPGVTGAYPEADVFADSWERATGARRRLRMAQGIYEVRTARPPADARGRMRLADRADRELIVDWIHAFQAESIPPDAPHMNVDEVVERRLAEVGGGGFALWDDGGETVSLSGYGGRTPHGIRIGPVYTPPPLRGRGYASGLVGQLSKHLLEGGLDYCFLYTDLANPTSNRIYMNVGYELVCESADYAFEN
jgi:predicted GNAT family acetyltransferase